jgi:hypothetical protein
MKNKKYRKENKSFFPGGNEDSKALQEDKSIRN